MSGHWDYVRRNLLKCDTPSHQCSACQGLTYDEVHRSGGFNFRYCKACALALVNNAEYRKRVTELPENWLGDGLWDRFAAERHRIWMGLQPQPKEQRPVPVWEEPNV